MITQPSKAIVTAVLLFLMIRDCVSRRHLAVNKPVAGWEGGGPTVRRPPSSSFLSHPRPPRPPSHPPAQAVA